MAQTWTSRNLVASIAGLPAAVASGVAAAGTATSIMTSAAAMASAINVIPSAAAVAANLAVSGATEVLLAALDFTPFAMCPIYPQVLDVQRAKLKERTSYLEDQLAQMRAQRTTASSDFAVLRRTTNDTVLHAALADSALDADEVLSGLDSDPGATENSLDESIRKTSIALSALRRQDKMMANPSLPVTFPFGSWVSLLEESFGDTLDKRRPIVSGTTLTGGIVILVSANSIAAFAEAVKGLASILRFPKMARAASALYSATTYKRPLPEKRYGVGRFPDWYSVNMAQMLGLKKDIDDLKRKVNSLTFQTSSAKYARYLAMVTAAANDALTMGTALATAFVALANADVGVHVLVVPPSDGVTTLQILGKSFEVPNGTYGTDGYVNVIRNAANAPTGDYVAGVAFFTQSPLPGLTALIPGFDGVSSVNPAMLTGIIGETQLDAVVTTIRAGVSAINAQLGPIKAVLG